VQQVNVGGQVVRPSWPNDAQPARPGSAFPTHSASQPARKLLSLRGIGAKLTVSERTAQLLTAEPWFPPAIVLGPRIRRWDEAEVDAALAARAPRQTERVEPQQLVRARIERMKAGGAAVAAAGA
jgi:predicted DNA-binding transcriptional regulator AlpA